MQEFSWYPKQTNAFELYVKAGRDWKKIDSSKLTYKQDFTDDWVNIPSEMLSYIKDLKEFDAKLFKDITGLEDLDDEVEITIEGKTKRISRKSAKALNLI